MKRLLVHGLVLSMLLALAACSGGGSTNATLEVSRAFAASNVELKGGLLIKGRNLLTGAWFSQGLVAGTEFKTKLDKGLWRISAVGWDGGLGELKFAGTPYCGILEKNLANDTEELEIVISKTDCQNPQFSSGHVDTSAIPTFRKINVINTCNTFFEYPISPTDQISTKFVKDSTSLEYCESSDVPLDQRSKVKSMLIQSLDKQVGHGQFAIGFSTTCLTPDASANSKLFPTSNGYNTMTQLRLPFNSAAFVISTFEDNTCDKKIADYPFFDGLHHGARSQFDHRLVDVGTDEVRLFLPSSDLRRTMSPFQALLPQINRNDGSSGSLYDVTPTSTSAYVTQIDTNIRKVFVKNVDTCEVITGKININVTCAETTDGVVFTVDAVVPETATSFIMGSKSFNFKVKDLPGAKNKFYAQRLALELLGHKKDGNTSEFFQLNEDADNKYGVLSKVRDMLAGNGAGGIIGIQNESDTFVDACLNAQGEGRVDIPKEGHVESFYVKVSSISPVESPTKYTCITNDPDVTDCAGSNPFEKRIKIYNLNSRPMLENVLEFNCALPIGRMEINKINKEMDITYRDRQIITWNTDSAFLDRYQRFETFTSRVELNLWLLPTKNESRTITRFFKTAPADFEVLHYDFSTFKEATQYAQQANFTRLKSSGTQLYFSRTGEHIVDDSEIYVLSSPSYNTFLYTPAASVGVNDTITIAGTYAPDPTPYTPSNFSDSTTANYIGDIYPLEPKSLRFESFPSQFEGPFFLND